MKTKIAYTIGDKTSYNQSLAENPQTKKIGKREDYEGGIIWKTAEEVFDFIITTPEGFNKWSVYELELPSSFEEDVSKEIEKDGSRRLINDAKVIREIIHFKE